ncbi:transcriptional repressor [Leptospira congkakensis]|uniref:Transcriptional repressor n=1 Tax=Leptospira congkakensis TaxID=2484932 RepID=A0A4Z1AFM9_9LEPT|nr:Fur family transcriptional regulator [Leptospira congkakensis]TGL87199.1 transcriptional repressor [Leptospira congkakensis]TGL96766.1 transcriptional repressor [Leptospira congkakensis]TGL97616.1 transcriptional repressor [Leptospira congkakensis]
MDLSYQKTKELLESHGIRPTSQRLEMAHLLLERHQHLFAEEVFHLVNSHFPHASRATIFNNLKLFAEKGMLGTLELKNGVTHFDSNIDPHHHALNEETGEITDVEMDEVLESKVLEELKDSYFKKTGKKLDNVKLVITLKGK